MKKPKKKRLPEWWYRDQARRGARNKLNPDFPLPKSQCGVEEHIKWMYDLKYGLNKGQK